MTAELVLPLHEPRSRRLLAALHDRDRRPPPVRAVHEHLLLRALHRKR